MKQHFKFIGGPLDGEYHEIDIGKQDYVHVKAPSKVSFKPEPVDEPVLDEEGEPVLDNFGEPMMRMIKPEFGYTRYTLRWMSGEAGNVYWFAPDNWPDMYSLSQFVHHYPGR